MCFLLLWKRLDEKMKNKMDIKMKNFHILDIFETRIFRGGGRKSGKYRR